MPMRNGRGACKHACAGAGAVRKSSREPGVPV
jgi:hypothetical protein